jgi:hypothetical protein
MRIGAGFRRVCVAGADRPDRFVRYYDSGELLFGKGSYPFVKLFDQYVFHIPLFAFSDAYNRRESRFERCSGLF